VCVCVCVSVCVSVCVPQALLLPQAIVFFTAAEQHAF